MSQNTQRINVHTHTHTHTSTLHGSPRGHEDFWGCSPVSMFIYSCSSLWRSLIVSPQTAGRVGSDWTSTKSSYPARWSCLLHIAGCECERIVWLFQVMARPPVTARSLIPSLPGLDPLSSPVAIHSVSAVPDSESSNRNCIHASFICIFSLGALVSPNSTVHVQI